jgi:hypothetical protein
MGAGYLRSGLGIVAMFRLFSNLIGGYQRG